MAHVYQGPGRGFSQAQVLAILSALTELGYVSEYSRCQNPCARGFWACELGSNSPCILVCPALSPLGPHPDDGELALMLFADGSRLIHCGLSGMIDRMNPDMPLLTAIEEIEAIAAIAA